MNTWSKLYEKKVDQREFNLPPLWHETPMIQTGKPSEMGIRVHQSGPGTVVARRLLNLIYTAEHMVVVASFLMADERIEKAVLDVSKRNVHVYIMIASEVRLGRDPGNDDEFGKKVLQVHKRMLRQIGPNVLIRSAGHFHPKAVLVDPFSSPKGILLTSNLTKAALDRNEELAVELSADEVQDVAEILKWAMWEGAEHEMCGSDRFGTAGALGIVDEPGSMSSGVVFTASGKHSLRDKVIEIIDSADNRIEVSSFGWGTNHMVVKRLCERAREGLSVIVHCRIRPSCMDALILLAQAGAEIHGFQYLHAKAVVADEGKGMVMTANLERYGLDEGFELGISFGRKRAVEVLSYMAGWREKSHWILYPASKARDIEGRVQYWIDERLHDGRVAKASETDLGTITAKSVDHLEIEPDFPESRFQYDFSHEIIYKWSILPPVLHPKAKEVRQNSNKKGGDTKKVSYDPPVFKYPSGKTVVAVKKQSQLSAAQKIQDRVGADSIVLMENKK